MDLEKIFSNLGGTFITPADEIRKTLAGIKVFIFDWDGVFNNGMKFGELGSPFSEIDSMGINLLRFSFWLKTGAIPKCYIITGMNNQTAAGFGKREHFDGIFMNLKKKKEGLDTITSLLKINPGEVAFIFDDVIDIETAKECGLSLCVKRKSNPLLNEYILENSVGDYISASQGDNHAVREICELLMGLNGNFRETMDARKCFSPEYDAYLKTREQIVTSAEMIPPRKVGFR